MKFLKEYKKIKNNYRSLSAMEKFIIWTRFRTTPINELLKMVPSGGNFLDFGCGFGVFSYFFAWRNPRLKIIGMDPSVDRINLAENVFTKPENLCFKQSKIENLAEGDFDSILFVDVLYLLSEEELIRTLEICHQKLRKGGTLIIKAMNKDHFLRYALSMLITMSIAAVIAISNVLPRQIKKIINKFFGSRKDFPKHYRSEEFKNILEQLTWQEIEIYDLPMKFFIYPNIIYFCKK